MHRFRSLSFLALVLILFSQCGNDQPSLDGIDLEKWRDDKNGCTFYRAGTIDTLRAQKSKILALEEMEVIKLLGKPDRNELYKRNQKFYSYFIDPSSACATDSLTLNGLRLNVRFNAMGLAKEVAIE